MTTTDKTAEQEAEERLRNAGEEIDKLASQLSAAQERIKELERELETLKATTITLSEDDAKKFMGALEQLPAKLKEGEVVRED